jgi:CheY-like chemotaxis protein
MKGTILAVDDDPDIIDALAVILETNGYQVVAAQDGAEGLARLQSGRPDLIILDLLMPRMDGFEFRKDLDRQEWNKFRGIPILILTSLREEAVRRRYELDTGSPLEADDYIEKPIVPDILLRKVDRIMSLPSPSLN